MNIGMLWFDNDPKAGLNTKLERAATYYRNKYGQNPTLCFVHPSMLTAIPAATDKGSESNITPTKPSENQLDSYVSGGIEIRSNRSVLPNHFWIGVNGKNGNEPQLP